MYKKLISCILVVALLNLLGCYSSELINVTEYNQIEEKEDKPNEIYVKTKDYREYHFSDSNFYIENDTLYGRAILLPGEDGMPFEGKFAFSEIKTIQAENYGYMTALAFQKIKAESGKPDEIYLTKYDNTRYHFMKNHYYMINDTLFGNGKIIIDREQQLDREKQLDRKIALSDIESIQFEDVDGVKTTVLVIGIVAIILILAAATFAPNFGNGFLGN